jgi:hypothetical protein
VLIAFVISSDLRFLIVAAFALCSPSKSCYDLQELKRGSSAGEAGVTDTEERIGEINRRVEELDKE